MLEPGERRIYELEFGVVAGHDAVEALASSITDLRGERTTTTP